MDRRILQRYNLQSLAQRSQELLPATPNHIQLFPVTVVAPSSMAYFLQCILYYLIKFLEQTLPLHPCNLENINT